MKKTALKIAALALLATLVLGVFVACGDTKNNIEGTYSNVEDFTGVTFEFKNDGTVNAKRLSTGREDFAASGTYTIADGKITITYTSRENGTSEIAAKYSGEMTFESGDGFVKINGVEYKKA